LQGVANKTRQAMETAFSYVVSVGFLALTNLRAATGRLWWGWAVTVDLLYAAAITFVVVMLLRARSRRRSAESGGR
jgi:hypothetical protein